jgi:hypothetical protein
MRRWNKGVGYCAAITNIAPALEKILEESQAENIKQTTDNQIDEKN